MWRCRSLVLCSAARSVIFRKSSVLRVISAILGRAVSPSAISFYMFCPAAAEVERAGCCGTDGLSQSTTHTHTHSHTHTHTLSHTQTYQFSEGLLNRLEVSLHLSASLPFPLVLLLSLFLRAVSLLPLLLQLLYICLPLPQIETPL